MCQHFSSLADASNPLKGYVAAKDFRYGITTFLRSSGADNPLTTYAKKTYVDDKIKGIKGGGGGTVDLSGYTKQTDFITFKDKVQKDFVLFVTLRSDCCKKLHAKKRSRCCKDRKKIGSLDG